MVLLKPIDKSSSSMDTPDPSLIHILEVVLGEFQTSVLQFIHGDTTDRMSISAPLSNFYGLLMQENMNLTVFKTVLLVHYVLSYFPVMKVGSSAIRQNKAVSCRLIIIVSKLSPAVVQQLIYKNKQLLALAGQLIWFEYYPHMPRLWV